MPEKSDKQLNFWQELKRRKVVRVITVYAAAAFVILELVDIVSPALGLPSWTLGFVIVILCIGFIISVILSWIYDITPEGVQKTKPSRKNQKGGKISGSKGWKIATYLSIVVIIGLLIINLAGRKQKTEKYPELEKSIAVLPFENLSSDEEHAWFSDGITDVIINQLSKIANYRVIGRTSTLKYKEEKKSIPEIGEELGVNYIIEGTVQRQENELRISVQLVRVFNEDHIWSDLYDREVKDIFNIQTDIAKHIAEELKTALTPEEINNIEKKPTENVQAYNLYLKGRYFWNKRTKDGMKEAEDYFNAAIDLDGNYALAWAGLADCYFMTVDYMYVTSKDSIRDYKQKAKDAAIKALEFDPSLSEALATLAYIKLNFEWDWNGALEDFEKAIELNPHYGTAHQWYANLLTVLNQHDKAVAEAKLARQIDPLSPIINRNVARRLYFAHKYEQAIEASLNALRIKPDFFPSLWTLSLSYLQNKNYSGAIQEMQKAVKYSGDDYFVKALLGYVYGTAGEQEEAKVILNELIETSKYKKIPAIAFAVIYIGLGENDIAMDWLEKAYEERTNHLIYLNSNPIYDPIRSESRFIELVKKMNFPNSGMI